MASIDPSAAVASNRIGLPWDRFPRVWVAIESLCVMLLFFVFAGGTPPGRNESHYLTRGKHFWDPSWCAGDLFLESPESQPLFQTLFGWPTLHLSLPTVAWLGRCVGWAGLAVSWVRLARIAVGGAGWGWLGAGLALVLWRWGHMAGEWVVGGIEAKVPAYALLFWAVGSIARNQWSGGWLALSLATAFHPLVGGWGLVAAAIAWGMTWRSERTAVRECESPRTVATDFSNHRRSAMPWRRCRAGLLLLACGLLIGMGIVPAWGLDQAADAETIRLARWVYVLKRLDHHLLLTHFAPHLIARHVAMVTLWWWLVHGRRPYLTAAMRQVQRFVTGCVAIAIVGLAIELITIRNWEFTSAWMRYYWYRMSDALVPVGLALICTEIVRDRFQASRRRGDGALAIALLVISFGMTSSFYERHQPSGRMLPEGASRVGHFQVNDAEADYDAWRSACEWCRVATPTDSLFLTPVDSQTFKWYGERAEYATWKDIPQSSQAIVEWWDRHRAMRTNGFGSQRAPSEGQFPPSVILRQPHLNWARSQSIDYVLLRKEAQQAIWLARIVYENDRFVIYEIRNSNASTEKTRD